MKNLEKILENLPKPKLRLAAGLKIKFKLYGFIILSKAARLSDFSVSGKLNFRSSLAAALVVIIVFSGTSIYAYANNEIAPGHSLYALKRAMEKVEAQAALTNPLKAKTFQKFSARRLEEALHLSQRQATDDQDEQKAMVSGEIRKNIDEAIANITSAASAVNEIKDSAKADAVKNEMKEKDNFEIKYLNQIADGAALNKDEALVDKVKEAKGAMEKYQKTWNNDREDDQENKIEKIREKEGSKDAPADNIKQESIRAPESKKPSEKMKSSEKKQKKNQDKDEDKDKDKSKEVREIEEVKGIKIDKNEIPAVILKPAETASTSPAIVQPSQPSAVQSEANNTQATSTAPSQTAQPLTVQPSTENNQQPEAASPENNSGEQVEQKSSTPVAPTTETVDRDRDGDGDRNGGERDGDGNRNTDGERDRDND